MAKYTETFAEYLDKGGTLPTSFNLITGFEDLFKHYYCDKEIGFETEALFFMKLDMYADLHMQRYKDRLDLEASILTEFEDPTKYINDVQTDELDAGAQSGTTTELPFDATDAQPSVKNDTSAYRNVATKRYNRTEHGATDDEALRRVEFIQKRMEAIKIQLLEEFKPCFMEIY